MIRFVAMTPELFGMLAVRPEYAGQDVASSPAAQAAVCVAPHVALAMLDDGRMMAAAGVLQVWRGRGIAWFLPGQGMERRHFGRALARCETELARLHTAGMWRVECTVLAGQPSRYRWATRLGFAEEGRMRGFAPDGDDHVLLARVTATHDERRSLVARLMEAA